MFASERAMHIVFLRNWLGFGENREGDRVDDSSSEQAVTSDVQNGWTQGPLLPTTPSSASTSLTSRPVGSSPRRPWELRPRGSPSSASQGRQ